MHRLSPEYLLHRSAARRYQPSRLQRYSFAVIITLIILIGQYFLTPYFNAIYIDLFLALILSSWYGGLGPGLLSTIMCSIAIAFFLQPIHGLGDMAGNLRILVFTCEGALLALLCELNMQRDNALSRSSTLYTNLLTAQSDLGEGVILVEEGKILYINEAVERISGFNRTDMPDLEFLISRIVPERQEGIRAHLQESLQGGQMGGVYETVLVRRDGQRLDLEISVKMIMINRHTNLIILVRDITERKAFEETLRRSEEHYRLLVENVRDYAIFTLKKNGEIASWNEGAERILGYDENDIVGKHFSLIFSEEEIRRKLPEHVLTSAEKEGRATEQSWHRRKDGSLLFASGVTTPLWNDSGKLRGFIKVVQDITDQKESAEQIKHQALHDALTDLPNRILFCDRVDQAIAGYKRSKKQLAIIFLDLDKFKNINDSLGHGLGDQLLQQVAGRLNAAIREQDTVARFGGDEFTILLPDIAGTDDCIKVTKKIFKALRPAFNVGGHELHINTSMGISLYPHNGHDVQTLLKNADTALYQAKGQGRNTFQIYTPEMNLQVDKNLILENELRQALDRGEFILHYQPIMDAKTGQMAGVEALIRWMHPRNGLVNPGEFIPLAEETGIIVALNEWVMKTACRQSAQWAAQGLPPLTMSVNVSVRQFIQKNLVDKIAKIVQETGVNPELLELEVTESFAMHDIVTTTQRLEELRALGVHIAIDDFGTGHSSLNYLKHLPINTLKIDKSFIKGCDQSRQDAEIVKAISVIAHSLDLKVVAEGVETPEQLKYVEELECDLVQGFIYSKPLPVNELEELLEKKA